MLAMASSAEEVLAQLRGDVYAAEVWDMEKVQIIPVSFFLFLSGFTFWVGWCGGDEGSMDGGEDGMGGRKLVEMVGVLLEADSGVVQDGGESAVVERTEGRVVTARE